MRAEALSLGDGQGRSGRLAVPTSQLVDGGRVWGGVDLVGSGMGGLVGRWLCVGLWCGTQGGGGK